MTTEDDFQRALDANSADHQTRLVFADWLQDRDDPRADGYRLMGTASLIACEFGQRWSWWDWTRGGRHPSSLVFDETGTGELPRDWYDAIDRAADVEHHTKHFRSRREAEDAAALAFATLPAPRRAELFAMADDENQP